MTAVLVRRLRPGDEELVASLGRDRALAAKDAHDLLLDDAVHFLVAFLDDEPVGFALCYVLRRRRLPARSLFLYEIEVDERFRRRGIGRLLMDEVARIAREEGAAEGFVITNRSNAPGVGLYRAAGGVEQGDPDEVVFDFDYGPV